MLRLTVDKTQTLKEFTENNYAQASFVWNYLLKNKEIKVNGKKVGEDITLAEGDTVCYYLTAKQAEKAAFYIVYKDENILIADKESGVNSEAVFAALKREYESCRFIHRLDRNTKGLLAFALNGETESALKQAFKERTAEKIYHALCFGDFPKARDVLTAYLQKDEARSLVKIFDNPIRGTERIVTEYEVLERAKEITKVQITLRTGKTHQIRAHLAHIGCPVVGDMKYGKTLENKARSAARQCLVAKSLSFDLDGELSYLKEKRFVSRFEAELPQ